MAPHSMVVEEVGISWLSVVVTKLYLGDLLYTDNKDDNYTNVIQKRAAVIGSVGAAT